MKNVQAMSVCPPPSVLAAFVEGALDGRFRAVVANHLVRCPECVGVAGATAQFLTEEAVNGVFQNEGHFASPWRLGVAAALIVTLSIALGWSAIAYRDPLRRLRRIGAESSTRRVEGRLARFAYAPLVVSRGEPEPGSLAYRAELERLLARSPRDAKGLHALGVAFLLNDDTEDAVRSLEAAARVDPVDAETWNDLAAAGIARSSYPFALAAADRAIALTPDAAPAHFNRALALERLGRDGEARRTYRVALACESDPRWRGEIAERLSELRR